MGKTHRNLPISKHRQFRKPKHKHKILAGESPKEIITDDDELPVAAKKEVWSQKTKYKTHENHY